MDGFYVLVCTKDGVPTSVTVEPADPAKFKALKRAAKKLVKDKSGPGSPQVQIFGVIGAGEPSGAGYLTDDQVNEWRGRPSA